MLECYYAKQKGTQTVLTMMNMGLGILSWLTDHSRCFDHQEKQILPSPDGPWHVP